MLADRDVWRLNLELLPPQTSRTLLALKEEAMCALSFAMWILFVLCLLYANVFINS